MADTYFTLRKLTGPTERDLGGTFQHMAELLGRADEAARVQFRILTGERESCWTLAVVQKSWRVRAEETKRPDFEIIATAETWWQIADGQLSPFRAFLQGKMRVRGNIDLGKRLLQRIASPESASAEQGA